MVVFLLYTLLIKFVDVKAIGPNDSKVGFATLNKAFHNLTGLNMTWYQITKYAGYMVFVIAFATLAYAVFQFIYYGRINKVDKKLLVLLMMYVLIAIAYIFFEIVVINRRPELINGKLSASYPSSHTFLAVSVIPCVVLWLKDRIEDYLIAYIFYGASVLLTAFIIIGRTISGVHWITDIIGGLLLGAVITTLYAKTIEDMH